MRDTQRSRGGEVCTWTSANDRVSLFRFGTSSSMAVSLPVVLLSVFLFFACGVTRGRCDVTPVCNPSDFSLQPTAPGFPSLPDQFSTTVQAAIQSGRIFGGRRVEMIAREYFDDPGNRGRIEVAYNESSRYIIVDYPSRQIFRVSGGGEECSVEEVTAENPVLRETFGFVLRDGAPHIGTAAHFFGVNTTENNVRFIWEEESIRGIPCNHWQACFTSVNRSYTIDYYFSRNDTDWTSAYGNDPIPVMIIVNGTNADDNNGTYSVTNIYTFVDFNSGPDSVPDDVFRVPNGLSCKGRNPGMPLPSLPDYFSTFVEIVDENEKSVTVLKEFYDFKFQLFRVDFFTEGENHDQGPHTFIQDFGLETSYYIDRRFRNCTITTIQPKASFDTIVVNDRATLASSGQLLLFADASNYTYEGVSRVRGVEVDTWIFYSDYQELRGGLNVTNLVHEVFFTRPEWTIQSHSSGRSSEPSLWRSKVSGIFTYVNDSTNDTETVDYTGTFDVFSLNRGEPDLDMFDTSVCVSFSDYYIVTFYLPVKGIAVDFSLLPQNLRGAIVGFTQVQPLQIGNIKVIGGNASELIVSFHLSNLSNVSIEALKALDSTPVSAYQAITALRNSAIVNNSKLNFKIPLSSDGKQTTQPQLVFARSENEIVYHRSCGGERDSDSDDGLSDGAIAGIAVWMFVLGLGLGVIGTLGILLLMPCLRKKSFFPGKVSYKKHEDEKVTVSE